MERIASVKWYVWLALIVFLGAFLRFYQLGNLSFVADEFLDINSSYGYAQTGVWQAWNFNAGQPDVDNVNAARDERANIYKWQVAQILRHFEPTEAAARSISALWGIVTMFLVYAVATYFTKRREVGLVAAFLYAVSVSGIEIDRRLRMYAMFVPIFLAFWWMTFRLLEESYEGKVRFVRSVWERFGFNLVYAIPVLLLGALSLSLHLLTVNIAAVVVVYALISAVRAWRTSGERWNKYVFVLTAFVAGLFGVAFLFPDAWSLIASSLNFPDNHYAYFGIVLEDYQHWLLALLVFGAGIALLARQDMAERGRFVAVSFLTLLFLAVFVWKRNVGEQYIAFAEPLKVLVMAVGVIAVVDFVRSKIGNTTEKATVMTGALLLLLLPNFLYFTEENNTYTQTSQGDKPNYRSVFAYVVKHRVPEDVLVTRSFRNYYWSGSRMETVDFGGELVKTGQAEKLTLEKMQNVMASHRSGWVVLSENDEDYVSKDAREFLENDLEKVHALQVRGPINVYRWGQQE